MFLVIDTNKVGQINVGKNDLKISVFDNFSPLEPSIYEFTLVIEFKDGDYSDSENSEEDD